MKKKGLVSPVFKYMFALIVGVMFLLFFINLGMNYLEGSTSVQATTLTYSFDDIMDALSTSAHSVKEYNFGTTTPLKFSLGYIQSGTGLRISTNKIVFSPMFFNGQKLWIWSKRWYMPFPVTNFFFIHNKDYKYYFVSDTNSQEFVKELTDPLQEIPKEFGIGQYDISTIDNQMSSLKQSFTNIKRAKFVIFSSSQGASDLKNKLSSINNVDVLIIKKMGSTWDNGIVEFETGKSMYIGRPLLFGAVFAQDLKSYEHGLKRAFQDLKNLASINKIKTSHLIRATSLRGCSYAAISSGMSSMESKADTISKDVTLITETDVKGFVKISTSMDEANKQFGTTCPNVF